MRSQEVVPLQCPFCFEEIAILLDASAGSEQQFVYDCEVCCRPIEIQLRLRGETPELEVRRAYE